MSFVVSPNQDIPAMIISHKDQIDSGNNCALCCDGVLKTADHYYYYNNDNCLLTASRSDYEVWMRGGTLSASYTYSTNRNTITFGGSTVVLPPGNIGSGGEARLDLSCVAAILEGVGTVNSKSVVYGIIPVLQGTSTQFQYMHYISAEGSTSNNLYDPQWDHFNLLNYGGYDCTTCDPFGEASVNVTWNGGHAAPAPGRVCFEWFAAGDYNWSCNLNIVFTPNPNQVVY